LGVAGGRDTGDEWRWNSAFEVGADDGTVKKKKKEKKKRRWTGMISMLPWLSAYPTTPDVQGVFCS